MFKTLALFIITILVSQPILAYAESASDIRKTIEAKSQEIEQLQEEIEHYQDQVVAVSNQASSLQEVLNRITQNQKKLQSSIALTNKKIDRANLTIRKNEQEIRDLGNGIVSNTVALNETIRALNQNDERSIIELLVSEESLSEFFRGVDDLLVIQDSIKSHVTTMRDTRSGLEVAQVSLAKQKRELEQLKNQLADQKKIVDVEAREQADLLAQTKNQESQYQALLASRRAQVTALNAEIFNYESQLKFTINPNTLPKSGSEPLRWPLESVLITQRFGSTVDARRLYTSGSHSGVDFRAAVGTPVYAVASGTVEGTGDTDKTCYRASFGKWVFIRHTNGLATAYGHLSLIKAAQGQKVSAGDLIGYSGNTGHSTAPHLHLTVYAANGVDGEEGARIAERPSISCRGKTYRMPVAPTSAYLDPLLYLPRTNAGMFK